MFTEKKRGKIAILETLFALATFKGFGGIPLEKLSNSARRRLTGSPEGHSTNIPRTHTSGRERSRNLAFKARHGHFASEPEAGQYRVTHYRGY